MANTVAYRYRIYDASEDEYRYSTRLATKEQIERIGGEIVGRGISMDPADLLPDGWTERNYKGAHKG